MGGQTIKNEATQIAGIKIQSSAYGQCIPWQVAGLGRGAGNLLWCGNFKAIKQTTTSGGGKGGGVKQQSVTYRYEAAVMVGLVRGPIVGVGRVWRGKELLAGYGTAGFSLATGALAQPVWPWLQVYAPAEALGYSGLAYVYAQSYSLDDSASLPNHNFEINAGGIGLVPGLAEPVLDGDARTIVEAIITDTRSGAGWPAERLVGLDRYHAYCRSAGLWFSPMLAERRPAVEWLRHLLSLTNSRAAWTGSRLELVPMGDTDRNAYGAAFVAERTPDFDLTLDDFAPDDGEPPVRVRRHQGLSSEADAATTDDVGYNVVTLEIENRANAYALEPVSRDDLAHIERFGRNPKDTIKAPEIKSTSIAEQVAQQLLQDELAKRNRYEFNLTWRHSRLRPLRLVTLTEPALDLQRTPVRILSVEEGDDRRVSIVAEDAPFGIADAPRFGTQAGNGFAQDYGVSPGNALPPVIFEAPGALTTTGLEVMIATGSANPMWGGCQVWASYDGDTYRQIGEVRGGSRFGALSSVVGGTVDIGSMLGQLTSVSAVDREALATLSYIGGAHPEYIAYQTAVLTGPNRYALGTLLRGAYGSEVTAHDIGDPFVRVDEGVVSSGPLDVALVGKTLHVKLTSFNVFGSGQQSLADVGATSYEITGAFIVSTGGGSGFSLQATAQAFTFTGADAAQPAAQTITFKAILGGVEGSPTFVCTRYNAAGVSLGVVELGGASAVRTLTVAQFGAAAYCVVRCDLADLSDQCTIHRLRDGVNAISGFLSNEAATVATDAAGAGGSYGDAGGVFRVFDGLQEKTSSGAVVFSVKSSAGITGLAINAAGVYTLTGTTADTGTATLSALYAGTTIDKVYSISRSKVGNGVSVEYSVNGSSDWHSVFASGDMYMRQRVGTGAWSAPIRIVGEGGNYIDYIFRRAASPPATPVGNTPASWFDEPPAGTDPLYMSLAEKTPAGVVVGVWSAPVRIDGAAGVAGDAVTVEYSVNGSSGWHSVFAIGDLYMRQRIGAGAWSAAIRIVGEAGAGQYTLLPRANAVTSGSTAGKVGGASAWDSDVYSVQVYTGAAYAGARTSSTATHSMFGLSSNPLSTTGHDNLNYAIYFEAGTVWIYEGGVSRGTYGGYTTASVMAIVYGGSKVRYYRDGVLLLMTDAAAGQKLQFKATFHTPGASIDSIAFGPTGPDGLNALQLVLGTPAASVLADASGNIVSGGLSQAVTTVRVMDGQTDVTALWTISRTNGSGVSSSLSGSTVSVTGMTVDTSDITITASRSGYPSLTGRMVLTRVRSAAPTNGPVAQLYAYATGVNASSGSPAQAAVRIETNGQVTVRNGPSSTFTVVAEWFTPPTTNVGTAPGYWVKSTLVAGSAVGGSFNTWIKLTAALTYTLSATGGLSLSSSTKHVFATDAAGANVVGVLYADYTADHVG